MRERRAVTLALAVSAGIGIGFLAQALGDRTYRAEAVLQATVPPAPSGLPRAAAPELLAESYARLGSRRAFLEGIAGQVAGGLLTVDELEERVRTRRPEGTALVELTAEAPGQAEARALVADVAAALVALPRELARSQAAEAEDELRRRIQDVDGALADAAADEEQVARLEAERSALLAQIAELPMLTAERSGGLSVVAPAAVDPRPVAPSLVQNLLGGVLLGLVVWIGLNALGRTRPAPRAAVAPAGEPAPQREPERAGEPEPEPAGPPAVAITEPEHGVAVAGRVRLRADAARAARVSFLLSDGGGEWRSLGEGTELEWDTSGFAAGPYWVCAVATGADGAQAASELVPVRVT